MKSYQQQNWVAALAIFTAVWSMSCSSSKPAMVIPVEFSKDAVKIPVTGLAGTPGQRPITIGEYHTSKISRGWNTSSSTVKVDNISSFREWLLKQYDIEKRDVTTTQRDKFQFSMQHNGRTADIFATERQVTDITEFTLNHSVLGNPDFLNKATYAFIAGILTSKNGVPEQWQFVLLATKDPRNKTGNIFERHAWDEGGYLTNGKDTIQLQVVMKDSVLSKGKVVPMPFAVMKAYEFRTNGKLSVIVDSFGRNVWFDHAIDKEKEFVITCAAAALLLRRIG